MGTVEQEYWRRLRELTPEEKIQRCFDHFAFMHEFLRGIVTHEDPSLSEREIRRAIAKRLYIRDRGIQKVLQEIP